MPIAARASAGSWRKDECWLWREDALRIAKRNGYRDQVWKREPEWWSCAFQAEDRQLSPKLSGLHRMVKKALTAVSQEAYIPRVSRSTIW